MDISIGDKFIALDGNDLLEHENGKTIFEATSKPYLDELGILCIEVKTC
jgi:hypothetical protein